MSSDAIGWIAVGLVVLAIAMAWWWRLRRVRRAWQHVAAEFGWEAPRQHSGGVLTLDGSLDGRCVTLFGDPQPGDLPFGRLEIHLDHATHWRFRVATRSQYRYLGRQPVWGREVPLGVERFDANYSFETDMEALKPLPDVVVDQIDAIVSRHDGVITLEDDRLCFSRLGTMFEGVGPTCDLILAVWGLGKALEELSIEAYSHKT